MAETLKIWQVLLVCLVCCNVVVGLVFLVQIFFSKVKFGVVLAFAVLTSYWVFSLLFIKKIIIFLKSIRDGSNVRFSNIRWENVRTILAFSSAMVGMVFLALSSFSKDQFGENYTLQSLVFIILTAFFVANIFLRKKIISFLESLCGRYLFTKPVVQCISFAMVSLLALLIKYPRFSFRSAELTTSCISEDKEINQIYKRMHYRLFFFGASSLLIFLISPQSQETMALKISSWLLGLTIETSMEIPGSEGPNLRYMFGTALFCFLLILFNPYMDSQLESRARNTSQVNVRKIFKILFTRLVQCGTLYICYLPTYLGQSGDYTFVVEYILLGILVFIICAEMEQGIDSYNDHYSECQAKASLNIFLLLVTGILIISNKDDRFQIQSKFKKICAYQEKVKELPQGSQFNLYSSAAFSLYALVISLEKDQSMELGIFGFLYQLTMDASIDLTSAWYIVGASLYCVLLIFARIYLAPVKTRRDSNV